MGSPPAKSRRLLVAGSVFWMIGVSILESRFMTGGMDFGDPGFGLGREQVLDMDAGITRPGYLKGQFLLPC